MGLAYAMASKGLWVAIEEVQELWPRKVLSAESSRLLRARGK